MAIAGISAVALVATACGGGDNSSGSDGGGDGAAATGGEIIARGCENQNPLIPGDTGESCGHDVVELFTSTLFRYNPETSEPENDLAESVETEDNQNFTVKIKPDVKFHDGTPVTAESFVKAWNYTANAANAQYLSYFMEPIEGFADLQSEDPDGDGPKEAPEPKETEMSGLKVVDDTTFTIKTTEPVSNLPVRLGYTAFAPLPEVFFEKGAEEFAKKPVGAGPYMVESFSQGDETVLTKFADYGGGTAKGNADKITFRVYDESDAAYNDLLAGNIDTIDEIPSGQLVDDQWKSDLGDRVAEEAYPAIQTVTVAPEKTSPEYKDPKLRQAISMAIDRQKIIDDQFQGAREPATGWVAPGVTGFKGGACGEYCEYDAEKAKQLFDEAGGFDGKLTISYNADADHKAWVEATCNSIKGALGVDCVATPVPDFATFREQIGEEKMKGMFRSGWIADYPHIENFLTPLYATGGSSNDSKYSDEDFDAKLVEAGKLEEDESNAAYQEAEAMLAEDMGSIPMWYYTAQVGWSDKLDNVKISKASGRIDLLNASVKQ
ncbi:ABC transporter substrate-binding protein [Janibacter sp. Y6]|uniref:peptide ABC transporter substrate-binding protein n=1 Tax=Janibacter sp. Y6 TaxID=2913552 RepID=UPI0034A21CD8